MNDPTYKNLRLSDFPISTDVKATEETLQIVLDAETVFNWMLEHAATHGQRPVEVRLFLIDRVGLPQHLLMRAVAAAEGDTETIKRFYEQKKQTQRPDAD